MTNTNYLSESVEAARLRSITQIQDWLFEQEEQMERAEKLDEAYSYAPKMIFHRLPNLGWIVAVNLDSCTRPYETNTFSRLSESLMADAGMPVEKITDYTIFIKSHASEERIREEIALSCLPF